MNSKLHLSSKKKLNYRQNKSKHRQNKLNHRQKTLIYLSISSFIIFFTAIFGFIVTDAAYVTDFSQNNLLPSSKYLFGTDWMGRNMLYRTFSGLSLSIFIGTVAAFLSAIIGIILGTAAAVFGKKTDAVITWFIDLTLGIPHLVLLMLISYSLGKGVIGVVVGVALVHWTGMARIIRGEVLQLKESQYIKTASKLGQSKIKIAVTHILPHVFPQFIVGLILLFPHAILHEASITFLGFGLAPEQPAIGVILSESMRYLNTGMWWLAFFPGIALIIVVTMFDLAGSSLRKLIDPASFHE